MDYDEFCFVLENKLRAAGVRIRERTPLDDGGVLYDLQLDDVEHDNHARGLFPCEAWQMNPHHGLLLERLILDRLRSTLAHLSVPTPGSL